MSKPKPQGGVSPPVASASVEIIPCGPITGKIRVPGSKSITNRALVIAAMAKGSSHLSGVLASEDTAVMIDSLEKIGVTIETIGHNELVVHPCSLPRSAADPLTELFIANSGTTVRFLTAMLSAIGGHYRLRGVDRMHQRPIGDLVDSLREVVDGRLEAESPGQCPPVHMETEGWRDGDIVVAGNVSSQYLSGLMMAAGVAIGNVDAARGGPRRIRIEGELVSRPYVEMTAAVIRAFGVDVTIAGDEFSIHPRQPSGSSDGYEAVEYEIEPDASAASYFWAAAAITGGDVTVEGLTRDALQGDVGVVDVLEEMGCVVQHHGDAIRVQGRDLRGIDVDMNVISDTVQTIAPVALFADSPTRIRGVAHNRYKETDRIGDLATELRRFGGEILEHEDGLTIHPIDAAAKHEVQIETYHDHRMAMGLSLIGLRRENVRIKNPSCTGKTYPAFFADLELLAGRPWHWRS